MVDGINTNSAVAFSPLIRGPADARPQQGPVQGPGADGSAGSSQFDRTSVQLDRDNRQAEQIANAPDNPPATEQVDRSVDSVTISSTIGQRASASGLSRERAVEIYEQVSKLV